MATPKKNAPKNKTTPSLDAPIWNVVHLFGYGETQVIGAEINGKVANANLKTLEPFLTYLSGLQQKGTKIALKDLHSLNILNGTFIDFSSRDPKNKSQRFNWTDINPKQVSKFVDEAIKKISVQSTDHTTILKSLMSTVITRPKKNNISHPIGVVPLKIAKAAKAKR